MQPWMGCFPGDHSCWHRVPPLQQDSEPSLDRSWKWRLGGRCLLAVICHLEPMGYFGANTWQCRFSHAGLLKEKVYLRSNLSGENWTFLRWKIGWFVRDHQLKWLPWSGQADCETMCSRTSESIFGSFLGFIYLVILSCSSRLNFSK